MDSISDDPTAIHTGPVRSAAPRNVQDALLDEVRRAIQALTRLLLHEAALGPEASAAVRTACEDAQGRLDREEATVVLVGQAQAGKSTLLNGILGAPLLATDSRPCTSTVTFIRHGPVCDYTAHFRDGRVEQFSLKIPERAEPLTKSLRVAERHWAAAVATRDGQKATVGQASTEAARDQASLAKLDIAIEDARAEEVRAREEHEATIRDEGRLAKAPLPVLPRLVRTAPPWWAVWLWLLRLVLKPLYAKRLAVHVEAEAAVASAAQREQAAAKEVEASAAHLRSLEEPRREAGERLRATGDSLATARQELATARELAERAYVDVERLRAERDRSMLEWKEEFLAGVSELTFGQTHGADLVELRIDYPARHLPPGLTLIDTAGIRQGLDLEPTWLVIRRDADACIFVSNPEQEGTDEARAFLRQVHTAVPNVFIADRSPKEMRELVELVGRERLLLVGTRAATRVRTCLSGLKAERARGQASYNERLSALESERAREPAAFRGLEIARVQPGIDQAAGAVWASALATFHAAVAGIGTEYEATLASAKSRKALEACVLAINEGFPRRLGEALEAMGREISTLSSKAAEPLVDRLLEELRAHYRLDRFAVHNVAPEATRVTRDDFKELLLVMPLPGVMNRFEQERVSVGLGGAAAGALVGTLVLPVVGTAVGAFVGVFAGFLKGTGSLQHGCIHRLRECLEASEKQVRAQLEGRSAELSKIIRSSLDNALDRAFVELRQPIAKLIADERRAVDDERAKLEELLAIGVQLEESDARLADLVATAQRRVHAPSSEEAP